MMRPNTVKGAPSKAFQRMSIVFLVCVFAMPQYFGIGTASFALTAQRLTMLLMIAAIACNRDRRAEFAQSVAFEGISCAIVPLLFVMGFTAGYRDDLNSLLNTLIDAVIPFYLVMYIAKSVLGIPRTAKLLSRILLVVCLIACVDAALHWNPYELVHTIPSVAGGSTWRASSYRTAAMCSHPIAFGLYLILMTPVACYDHERRSVNIVKHLPTVLIASLAILLSGSRMPQCLLIAELAFIYLFTDREIRYGITPYLVIFFAFAVVLVYLFRDFGPVRRYVILNLCQLSDSLFGTNFTLENFGYWQWVYTQSWDYRNLLPLLFFSPDYDPLIGLGVKASNFSNFAAIINGRRVESIDNYYVLQYLQFAWPGVFAILAVFYAVIARCVSGWRRSGSRLCLLLGIGFLLYFVDLWFVADLGTFKYLFPLAAIACVGASAGLSKKQSK